MSGQDFVAGGVEGVGGDALFVSAAGDGLSADALSVDALSVAALEVGVDDKLSESPPFMPLRA
jgi:hypothetical protein